MGCRARCGRHKVVNPLPMVAGRESRNAFVGNPSCYGTPSTHVLTEHFVDLIAINCRGYLRRAPMNCLPAGPRARTNVATIDIPTKLPGLSRGALRCWASRRAGEGSHRLTRDLQPFVCKRKSTASADLRLEQTCHEPLLSFQQGSGRIDPYSGVLKQNYLKPDLSMFLCQAV